jgi:hypothetical protein
VNHHGIDAEGFQENDVQGEGFLQGFVGHGVAAVLDDDGFPGEAPDIGERFHEGIGFFDEMLHAVGPPASRKVVPEGAKERCNYSRWGEIINMKGEVTAAPESRQKAGGGAMLSGSTG